MAPSSFPKKRNPFKLSILSLSLAFLFFLFFFTRRALETKLFITRDLLPPRSVEVHVNLDGLRQPATQVSDPVDDNVTVSPDSSDNEVEETEPVSSESDLDDRTSENTTAGEITGEPLVLNEKTRVPISSKSDLDGEKDKSFEGNQGEITGEPLVLNEKTRVPISSKSDLDGEKEKSFEGSSENQGFLDNVGMEKLRNCDIYKGKWVRDEGYPLYRPRSCPYVDDGFDCQGNGRPDSAYLQWRWQPDDCDLPRFNAKDFLERLRGKKLTLVGDSMNRNQFESLLCILREGLSDKSKMYEVHGYKITKGRGYYVFKFEDYNCTVEFIRSHFLVREGIRINAQGNSNPTLSIDRIDKTARRWQRADILVFNTAHWWTHGKTSRGKNYYKEGNHIYPQFDAVEAYRRAIRTWAIWIKKNIKRDTLVFYRGYSSAHFRGGDWDSGGSCKGEKEPVFSGSILDSYPEKMRIVEQVMRQTKLKAVLLNVTQLTNYRKDGHPSIYGKNVTALKKVSTRRQDCSHWCLPGVPDAWNELIYTTLVARQT